MRLKSRPISGTICMVSHGGGGVVHVRHIRVCVHYRSLNVVFVAPTVFLPDLDENLSRFR